MRGQKQHVNSFVHTSVTTVQVLSGQIHWRNGTCTVIIARPTIEDTLEIKAINSSRPSFQEEENLLIKKSPDAYNGMNST